MANGQIISNIKATLSASRNDLLKEGVALQFNRFSTKRMGGGAVFIGTPTGGFSVYGSSDWASIENFRQCVKQSDYYLILNDGGIIQASFIIKQSVIRQRLVFIPCPFSFTQEEIIENGLLELIDNSISPSAPDEVRLVPRLRFEYDADAAEDHPIGHLHVGYARCRIPTKAIVNINRFMSFILSHYYEDHQELATALLNKSNEEDTSIRRPQESTLMYLDWDGQI